jgi:hypothetical protein
MSVCHIKQQHQLDVNQKLRVTAMDLGPLNTYRTVYLDFGCS